MNKLVVVLGVTTSVFAASTAYLARQLDIERQRTTPVASESTPSLPLDSRAHLPEGAVSPENPPQASTAARQDERQAQFKGPPMLDAKGYLRWLDNPDARADAFRATRASLRMSNPGLMELLGLRADDSDRLLDLLAEQMVARQATMLRCQTTKGCDFRQGDPDELTRTQELAALLGTDKFGRYQTYQQTIGERNEVNRFRTLLPAAHAMSNDQMEQMVAAFADERARLHREAIQQGGEVNGEGTLAGMTYYPNTYTTAAQQIESITQYSARLRERAGQILTSHQRAVFDQTQDDHLASVRATLLQREAAAAQGL
ncbi:MAG TPA: hypothetical protein VFS58_04435 [Steroidobacteraceae bacterium]|nr:hypothetical protein [Steroidobacteraceae bacterium]